MDNYKTTLIGDSTLGRDYIDDDILAGAVANYALVTE